MSDTHCHTHNLVDPDDALGARPWGIRVSAPSTDPFNLLVGGNWQREHWFASAQERDSALQQMRKRHGFYRIGDDPSIVLTRIDPSDAA